MIDIIDGKPESAMVKHPHDTSDTHTHVHALEDRYLDVIFCAFFLRKQQAREKSRALQKARKSVRLLPQMQQPRKGSKVSDFREDLALFQKPARPSTKATTVVFRRFGRTGVLSNLISELVSCQSRDNALPFGPLLLCVYQAKKKQQQLIYARQLYLLLHADKCNSPSCHVKECKSHNHDLV